jgi:hypothetical protein
MKLGIYQHYKGAFYQVIGLARHTETLEELVVYQNLYQPFGLCTRPKRMFLEALEYQGKNLQRFTYVAAGVQELPTLR